MSVLGEQLAEYLAVRRALGFKLADTERLLGQYLDYLDEHGERRITIATAVAWAVLPGGSDALHYVRLAAVRASPITCVSSIPRSRFLGFNCYGTDPRDVIRSSIPMRRSSG